MAEAKGKRASHPTAQSTSLRDLIAAIARGDAPPPPVAEFVGLRLVEATPDEAVMVMTVEPHQRSSLLKSLVAKPITW